MESKNIRSVARAIELLEIIQKKGGSVGVTEISQEIRLAKSTVYRLLETLVEKGMLSKDLAANKYSLGYKILELAFSASASWNLVNLAMPFLVELRDVYNETTALAIKVGLNYSYIAEAVSHQEFRVNPILGKSYPLHWAGTGKAILAYTTEEERNEALKIAPYSRSTPNTITDIDILKAQLEQIHQDGYSVSFGERAEGAAVIATPICDQRNIAVGAVCLVGPELRLRKMDLPATGAIMKEICHKIERVYRPLEYTSR